MAKFNRVIFLGVVVAVIGSTSAVTEDEKKALHDSVFPIVTECGKRYKVSVEQLIAAKKSHKHDGIDPCYYDCFFKKIGTINDKGLFDPVAAKADQRKYFHDQQELDKFDAIFDLCSSVNDAAVGDDAQGCQRAMLLVRCLEENDSSMDTL